MKKKETTKMQKALRDYFDRRDRRTNPSGEFDNAGRWYPSTEEKQSCCFYIRRPSRGWPYSLMTHCRTAEHVANLNDVDLKKLRSHISHFNRLAREVDSSNQSNQ